MKKTEWFHEAAPVKTSERNQTFLLAYDDSKPGQWKQWATALVEEDLKELLNHIIPWVFQY